MFRRFITRAMHALIRRTRAPRVTPAERYARVVAELMTETEQLAARLNETAAERASASWREAVSG